jgi:hypothetical protein
LTVKNQYFADQRDLFKYDLLLDLVDCQTDRRLTFIPMLTRNDGSGEGNVVWYECGGRRSMLFDFLRDALASGRRDIRLLHELFPCFDVRFTLYRDTEFFEDAKRREYFAGVPTDSLAHSVVFFDPDVGLQTGSMSYMSRNGIHKYLMFPELADIATRTTADSIIVVYQHLQMDATKRTGDVERKLRDLSTELGVPHAWAVQSGDLAFLVTVRDVAVAVRVALALDNHASRHGMAFLGALSTQGNGIRQLPQERPSAKPLPPLPMSNPGVARMPPLPRPGRQPVEFSQRWSTMAPSGKTTEPGYTNRNGQTVLRATGLMGTDHGQYVYVLKCERCSHQYGANGSDIWLRRCPKCQGGATGLAY